MMSSLNSGLDSLLNFIRIERYSFTILQNSFFSDSLFKEAKNTFSEKILPQLGISLNVVKELLSTSERDFSYFLA